MADVRQEWPEFVQVAHLDILARLYILRYQYADAAAVYETLAVRKQGLGDETVDLSERVELYRSAVLQVRVSSEPADNHASLIARQTPPHREDSHVISLSAPHDLVWRPHGENRNV